MPRRASTNLLHFMQDVDGRDKPGDDGKIPKMRPLWPNSGHFHYQIGQPFGRVQPADGAGGGGHRGQPPGSAASAEISAASRSGVNSVCAIRSAPFACTSTPALAN